MSGQFFGLSADAALGAQILSQLQNMGGLGGGLPGMGQQAPMQGVENLVSDGLNLVSDGFTRGTEEYPGQIDPGFRAHPKLPGGWAEMPRYYDKSNPPWAKPSATPPVDRIVRDGLGIVEGEWGPDSPAGKEGFMGWLTSEKGQQFLSSLQGMQQPQQQQQMPQFGPIGSGQFATAGNPLAPRQPVSWRS